MNTHEIVVYVNTLLDVEHDPIGVGAWWVQGNGRIDARPIDLLGTDREHEVVHAADSIVEPLG